MTENRRTTTATLTCRVELHARIAARVVYAVRNAHAPVMVSYGDALARADSITQLLALCAPAGATLRVTSAGGLGAALLDALRDALASDSEQLVSKQTGEPSRGAGWYRGLGVSPGQATGRIWKVERPGHEPEQLAAHCAGGTRAELGRLRRAVATARTQLDTMATERYREGSGAAVSDLLRAQQAILQDQALWRQVESRVRAGALSAEAALESAARSARDTSHGADLIEDALMRVIESLAAPRSRYDGQRPKSDVVWLSDTVRVSQVLGEHGAGVVAWLGVRGGYTTHAAVACRTLGLPMVLGLPGAVLKDLRDGDVVRIDGGSGTVVREPDPVDHGY